jgi:hypothetical protein
MIKNYSRCPQCHCITAIVLVLAPMPNRATHAIICTNCGTEGQVKLEVIETIRSDSNE